MWQKKKKGGDPAYCKKKECDLAITVLLYWSQDSALSGVTSELELKQKVVVKGRYWGRKAFCKNKLEQEQRP